MNDRKIALVSGGGSGIGRATAIALVEAGWRVVVAGRRESTLQETVALAARGHASAVTADVTDEVSVDALFDMVIGLHGRLDLLFNNAGVSADAVPLDQLPVSKMRELINVNLYGAMLCARAALRVMKAQSPRGGRIINNGSVSAYAPRPDTAPYTATKHAITGLTKSLVLDGRTSDVVCGQIDIGNVATDMTSYMQVGAAQPDGTVATEPRFPLDEIGRAVCYMASLSAEANIPFMTLMASKMPLYGRG